MFIAVAVAAGACAPAATPEPTSEPAVCRFEDSAAKVAASTVMACTPDGGCGSAFYVGNGEFVTAGHVVERARSVTLTNARVNATAIVIGYFPGDRGDIAILRAANVTLEPLDWAGTLDVGATVAFAGYPHAFGTDAAISRGVVSRLYTESGIAYIQTDAPSNPGNSGGPLFDECGRVAGVASWRIAEDSAEGLGFAVAEPSLNLLLVSIRSGSGWSEPSNSGGDDWDQRAWAERVSGGESDFQVDEDVAWAESVP